MIDHAVSLRFSAWRMFMGCVVVATLVMGSLLALSPVLVVGIAVPASVFIFPFTYLLITVVLEVYGPKASAHLILVSTFCLVLSALAVAVVAGMPPAPPLAGTSREAAWVAIRALLAGAFGLNAGYWTGLRVIQSLKRSTLMQRVLFFPMMAHIVSGTVLAVGGYWMRPGVPDALFHSILVNRNVFSILYSAMTAPLIYLLIDAVRVQERRNALVWLQQVQMRDALTKEPE